MTTRRNVLATTVTATAGVALGAALPAAAQAAPGGPASPGRDIPRTLASGRAALGGRLRVTDSKFTLSHLGVQWRGPAAQVRLRTARGWSRWQTLHGCTAGRDGHATPAGGSVLLLARDAVGYEIWVASDGATQTVELNTVDGPAIAAAAAAVAPSMPLPYRRSVPVPYLSRAAWGADESLRFTGETENWPTLYYPVQALTVHHTAGINDDPDPAATVRAIYYYQCITQGWGDIGYNLLIDEAGRVYEGRWSGSDGVPAFRGTSDAAMAGGAHAVGYNAGNIGVCLLGDFTSRLPTQAARTTLVRVLAGLAQVSALNPVGVTNYVNPVNGNSRTVQTISGHRDWGATECPGNLFYPELPGVREAVLAALPPSWAPRPVLPKPATTRFKPRPGA
ncbi:N-acetylmuramoyl-L-alanine amidase [Micromonospora sp. CPCC 205371]|nr:N-acetylmuramoyl-L-alanine amidase [Micromonospora sp. CPCC 205371]